MALKTDEQFEEELTCRFKIDVRNLMNFDSSTRKSQKFAPSWAAFDQSINVWAKKVRRSHSSWHWRMMLNLKRNWLVLPKMTWVIYQIFIRALKSLKIGTFMGSFYPKKKIYELTGELCVERKKNNATFEEELTCLFITDTRNLMNFDSSTQKSKIFAL